MKTKSFKPMLADNNQPELDSLIFPQFCSRKMDGVRIIFYKGQILSRSLKQIPNKQLREKFEPIRKYSEDNNLILDGEIYSHSLTFQQIISFTMTQDFEDKKSIKKFGKVMSIPEHLKFYCFDCLKGQYDEKPFQRRIEDVYSLKKKFRNIVETVDQYLIESKEELNDFFNKALKDGYEGLILKSPEGQYKYGRTRFRENLMYKLKPFQDFDAEIIEIIQATEAKEGSEKKINELGRSQTSRKKDDRELINKASCFKVLYEGKELKVSLALTDEEKIYIWENQKEFIGRIIQYKAMMIGSKDLPRHPIFQRYRDDKDAI
jgi:DNA ligase-1